MDKIAKEVLKRMTEPPHPPDIVVRKGQTLKLDNLIARSVIIEEGGRLEISGDLVVTGATSMIGSLSK